jgi:hypothetical protein
MLSRTDIEVILYDEVERTRALSDRARRAFTAVISEVPSNLPHPDGASRVTNARKLESAARSAYMTALLEFNRFILDGEIPARLEGDGEAPPNTREVLNSFQGAHDNSRGNAN